MSNVALALLVAWTILCLVIGALAYRQLFAGEPVSTVVETAAPPISMPDDSEVLARDPSAELDTRPPIRPPGHTVVRTVEVTVKPPPVDLPQRRVGDVICPAERVECPPMEVRWDLLLAPDRTYRVQASAPEGQVLGGIDKPGTPVLSVAYRHVIGFAHFADGSQLVRYGRRVGPVDVSIVVQAPEGFADTPGRELVPGLGIDRRW